MTTSTEDLLRGQLRTPEALGAYLLAGRAVVTLCSRKSGERCTLKVGRKHEHAGAPVGRAAGSGPVYFRAIYGPQDDKYLGCLSVYEDWRPARDLQGLAKQAEVARWLAGQLLASGGLARVLAQAEVWHEGLCGRCGRRLTVPASIESGFGPECRAVREGR